MKKTLIAALTLLVCFTINAQTTPKADSLDVYTGKYKFPAGTPVSEANITLDNGVLYATSDAGSSELKRIEGDIFEVVAYAGKATFKRSMEGKVNAITIEVDGAVMEGTKSEGLNFIYRQYNLSSL